MEATYLATHLRNLVQRLAKEDTVVAADLARSIKDPWRRAQALSWVARFSRDQTLQFAHEAEKAAAECGDEYQQVAVLAWVIAALVECDLGQEATRLLQAAVERAPHVNPAASRAEALILLLQAGISLGTHSAQPVVNILNSSCGQDHHWRCHRAIREAPRYLAGERLPRPFFW